MHKGDLHIHSIYSYDCSNSPRFIVKKSAKLGYDVISITDHNTMKGISEARDCGKEYGILVIPGIEVATDAGDLIGLDVSGDIKSRNWADVILEIKEKGGLSILPHPYRAHTNVEELASRCDVVEVLNARNSPDQDKKAADLAARLMKPTIAGSDAHTLSEVGNVSNVFEEFTRIKESTLVSRSTRLQKAWSNAVGDVRRRKFRNLPYDIKQPFNSRS